MRYVVLLLSLRSKNELNRYMEKNKTLFCLQFLLESNQNLCSRERSLDCCKIKASKSGSINFSQRFVFIVRPFLALFPCEI